MEEIYPKSNPELSVLESGKKLKRLDIFAAILLSTIYLILLLLTLPKVGLVVDELAYVSTVVSYTQWFLNPSFSTIYEYWAYFEVHPPFPKILGVITAYLFSKKLNILDPYQSVRISTIFLSSIMVFLIYFFSIEAFNRRVAVFSTLSIILMPRVFAHSHFFTMDMPLAVMWFLTVYFFWKGSKNRNFGILCGFVYGLALATKITAILIPIGFLIWLIVLLKKDIFSIRKIDEKFPGLKFSLLSMTFVSPTVLILVWPLLWLDPLKYFEYIKVMQHKDIIPVYYFGKSYSYTTPPWHYPFVITGITVPLTILSLTFLALVLFKRGNLENKNHAYSLIIINLFLPLLFHSLPFTHVYQGVRLFLMIFPFMAILSGIGFETLFEKIIKIIPQNFSKALSVLLAFGFLFPGALAIYNYTPHYYCYFNSLVGGAHGALEKGFEIEYYGEAYLEILDFLDKNVKNSMIDSIRPGILACYQRRGYFDENNLIFGFQNEVRLKNKFYPNYVVLTTRQSVFTNESWYIFKNIKPIKTVEVDGVPIAMIYKTNGSWYFYKNMEPVKNVNKVGNDYSVETPTRRLKIFPVYFFSVPGSRKIYLNFNVSILK